MLATDSGFHARDIVAHYNLPSELDGSGQQIALVTIGGEYRAEELRLYCALEGLPVPTVTAVALEGTANRQPAAFTGLLARSLQLLAAAAPGAEILLYRSANTEMGISNAIHSAVLPASGTPTVVCIPWAIPETENLELVQIVETTLQIALATGVTVCAAVEPSGDGSAAPWPASSPHVLACGATRLLQTEAGVSEEPAIDPSQAATLLASRVFPISQWQRGVVGPGEPRGRMLPDVTALADDQVGYRVYVDGLWQRIVGAGASACIWAGLLARLSEALGGQRGFFAGELYRKLGPAGVLSVAHPRERRYGLFRRGRAWQPLVGWGSPNGRQLLAAMKAQAR